MTVEPREARTAIATLRSVRQYLLEIHYHAGCVFAGEPTQLQASTETGS